MNGRAYRITVWTAILLLLALTGFTCILERQASGADSCKGIAVSIEGPWAFVSQDDIRLCLNEKFGQTQGVLLDSISLHRIESFLDGRRIVEKSQVWLTPDDSLHVLIEQRKPVVRFQKGAHGLYADRNGFIFPLQHRCTAQVPIIDGYLPKDGEDELFVKDLLDLSAYMEESGIWARDIAQISVDAHGEILMVPREGREIFIFGKPSNAEEKFKKMERYYTHIVPFKGPGYYSKVNLKYKDQIICSQ